MKKTLLALLCLSFSLASTQALTIMTTLRSPEECPKHLQITAKPDKKDADFVNVSVRFKPREHEPYIGRVKAAFSLKLAHKGETLFSSGLRTQKARDGFTTCHFRIRKSSLRESELTVSSSLFEKDGTPTVGGGVIYAIPLKGWIEPRGGVDKPQTAAGIQIELEPQPAIITR